MASGDQVGGSDRFLTTMLHGPLSDKVSVLMSQQGNPCGFFERQLYRCFEAYGVKLGRKYCDLEHRDFDECLHGDKQKKRRDAIRAQRDKLYKEGKLESRYEKLDIGVPQPDYYKWERIN